MKIEFEGRTWRWEEDEITVRQAEVIEAETGGSIWEWRDSIARGNSRAFRILYWLMLAQGGETVPLDEVDFAFPPFVLAYGLAFKAELDAHAAAEAEPDPTQPPATPPTPGGPPPGQLPATPLPASSPLPSSGS